MAVETWYLDADTGALTATNPGAETTTATGWTVAKIAPTVYALVSTSQKRASSTFAATAVPDGVTNPLAGGVFADALAVGGPSPTFVSGSYAAGTWTLTVKVIAVTSGGDQDGLIRAALWKETGSAVFTKIAGPTEGTAVTNLATTAAQTSTVTFAGVSAQTFASEVLVLQLGWKITGAGGANTRDVLFRKGTGITLVTPSFTAASSGTTYTKAGHGVEHG